MISGVEAFNEERWKSIQIKSKKGNCLTLDVEGMCTRCNVTSVNQTNGDVVQEPLKTLTKMEGRKFKFGVLASLRCHENENHSMNNPDLFSTNCHIDIKNNDSIALPS